VFGIAGVWWHLICDPAKAERFSVEVVDADADPMATCFESAHTAPSAICLAIVERRKRLTRTMDVRG